MKVFADMHHGGLYHSLQLMGKRVGFDIFRPVGMEWFHEGFFGLAEPYGNAIETVEQYLKPVKQDITVANNAPAMNARVNIFVESPLMDGPVYRYWDYAHECWQDAITLETFKKNKFDVIIASIPQDLEKFFNLRNQYQPDAKLIFQVGNPYWSPPPYECYPNILDSCNLSWPSNYNKIVYHQEYDTDIFKFSEPDFTSKIISSFIIFPHRMDLFKTLRSLLPDYEFRAFGHSEDCTDPPLTGISNIAKEMAKSRFAFHCKDIDGYGHIIHNWFAIGRPLIGSFKAYTGRLAERVWISPWNSIDVDISSPEEIVKWVKDGESYAEYNSRVRDLKFKNESYVDFEREGFLLKEFFGNLM